MARRRTVLYKRGVLEYAELIGKDAKSYREMESGTFHVTRAVELSIRTATLKRSLAIRFKQT
jgi:hypothetical protein